MKKLYTFLVLAFTVVLGNAQIVNIPDANFKAKLLAADISNGIASDGFGTGIKIDTNDNGEIEVSEALNVGSLYIDNSYISDLTGINSFSNLGTLWCYNNFITGSLDVSTLFNLTSLWCYDNQLSSLNASGLVNLNSLRCEQNNIAFLNIAGDINLNYFICGVNQLTSLNLTGINNLTTLGCSSNSLSSLNLTGLNNLSVLDCGNNLLTALDLSGTPNLTSLRFSYNQISEIDLSHTPNLGGISASHNLLTALNLLNLNLNNLDVANNQLTALDVSHCLVLQEYLRCSNNQLTTLDVSMCPRLNSLDCSNNQLYSLFIKNGKNESELDFSSNPNLNYVCADEGQLTTVQDKATLYGYISCEVNNYCSFAPGGVYYYVNGNSRFDSNGNGCDISDINYPNLKLSFDNGTTTIATISNSSGVHENYVVAGNYTITPTLENSTYFAVSPATASVTFPTTVSPFTQNFCVTANGVHNDLEVVLLPINEARPGFNATYKIIYKNNGTGVQSGIVNLTFDDTKMDLVSATPINTSSSTNSLSWAFSNLQPFETREILFTMNINSPTETPAVNAGDVLTYTATVVGATDETPIDNTSTLNQLVSNSLDPNDKTCVEGTTVSPSTVGQYVHYVIRFENTGTANAQNIVVKDMIDTTKYDVSSLVPLSGSASYTTRITNTNQVEFIFQNINLPFAAGSNDGYVAFKIKTKPTLVLGDTFSNSANIYFDYNAPIVTNTATTTIATLGTQDFEFSSVFTLSPVPAKNILTITTKQSVVLSSVSVYNTLGQLVQVNTNPNETIDVSGLKTGSYFIKIVSDKGTASSKFIKE